MPEPPLREEELRVLRGMMDEYRFGRARHQLFSQWWNDTGKALAIFGMLALLVLNVVQVVLAIHGGR